MTVETIEVLSLKDGSCLESGKKRESEKVTQLDVSGLDRDEKNRRRVSFAINHHPGTFSSVWDYKDRREILEERRTFFNDFIVIQRIYENDEEDDDDDKSSRKSSKQNETDAIETLEEVQQKMPEILVHRPSFAIPTRYLVDIEEIKERFRRPDSGMCKFVVCGLVFIAMVFAFIFAFLGIEHMED